MKKKVAFLTLIGGIILTAFYSVRNHQFAPCNELALQNVEALANGEGTPHNWCFEAGSIDCHGYKVKYKFLR